MKIHVAENLIAQCNSLSRVAALENAPRTQRLLKSVSDALRYRASRHDQLVRGRDEIAAATAFLDVFSLRFEDRFSYTVSDEFLVADLFIPHFTVMTFVENSVYHAFEGREGSWWLSVAARPRRLGVAITILDNGVGFDPRAATALPADYGTIESTIRRLRHHYGREVVSIASTPNEGTRVTIELDQEADR